MTSEDRTRAPGRFDRLAYEFISSLISLRQTRHALRTSRECLQCYRQVRETHPDLPACDVYKRVVMAQARVPEEDAGAILQKAAQSFANWPKPRPLTLVDVARYLAVSGYLAAGRPGFGTKVNMGLLVAGRIPPDL